jgi:hypothetical protein
LALDRRDGVMGIIRMGPPTDLILKLRDKYNLTRFVETGTYRGDTAVWAASHFDAVTTIESSRIIHDQAVANYGDISNIEFVLGHSRYVLKRVVPKLKEAAVFWLDAHWCGSDSYGEEDQCPLLEEITEINRSSVAHFLFIDDARLFTSPPPLPNLIESWPSITEVIQALQSGEDKYYIVIFEDVIIAVPHYAKAAVASYCQEINTRAWEERGKRRKHMKELEAKRGCRLIARGVRLVSRGIYNWLSCLIQPRSG